MRHPVAVLALPDSVPMNVAVPLEVFGRAAQLGLGYEVLLCGDPAPIGPHGVWTPPNPLAAAAAADTLIVPGRYDHAGPTDTAVLDLLRAAAARGARLASVCGGSFVLAQAGLLDGRSATTHWYVAGQLQALHPDVLVDSRPMYVQDGHVTTGAGLAAALDLCIHLVRTDHGAAAAARLARVMVIAPHREGGQAQFIDTPPARRDGNLSELRGWLLESLPEQHTLAEMARRASCSERTLLRHFHAETGQSPHQWLTDQRVHAAQVRLETTEETTADIAHRTGLGTAANLRRHFGTAVGVSPDTYRRSHRDRSQPPRTPMVR